MPLSFKHFASRWLIALCLYALIPLCLLSELHATKDIHVATKKGSGVRIKLTGLYNEMPMLGFYPMVLSIKNGTTDTLNYDLRLNLKVGYEPYATRTQKNFSYEVAPGESRSFELLLTVPKGISMRGNCELTGSIKGSFIKSGQRTIREGFYYNHSRHTERVFTCLSPILYVEHWGRVSVDGKGKEDPKLYGSNLELALLPKNWRGYFGIDFLWLTEKEWAQLNAAQQNAIIEWVSMGGRLNFIDQGDPAQFIGTLGLEDDYNSGIVAHGLGNVYYLSTVGQSKVDVSNALKRRLFDEETLSQQLQRNDSFYWPIYSLMEVRELSVLFITLFLIVFGVLVGPVNIFMWAKGSKRYRLFFTTPLISIIASVLLLIYILLKDGVGGEGARNRLLYFSPTQRSALMLQEQVSQTGVLLNREFSMPSEPFILNATPDSGRRNQKGKGHFIQTGDTYRGDWFSNRDEQEYYLGTLLNTRSRLELVKHDPPELLSSIDAVLSEVFYIDQNGVVWKASHLALGQKVTFERSDFKTLKLWIKHKLADNNPLLLKHIENVKNRKNVFIATVSNFNDSTLDTLPSIRWKHEESIFAGKVFSEQSGMSKEAAE